MRSVCIAASMSISLRRFLKSPYFACFGGHLPSIAQLASASHYHIAPHKFIAAQNYV